MADANAKNANQTTHKPDPTRLPKSVVWAEYKEDEFFCNGEQVLVALPIDGYFKTWRYKFEVITVTYDEDYISFEDSNGDPWGWELCDCDYYSRLKA